MIPLITFDSLPESVTIHGHEYPVNYGYRAQMAIEMEMFGDHSDEQKILNALNLFYLENIPEDKNEAIEKMLWFHRCGEEEQKETDKDAPKKSQKRAYCFRKDAGLIYAAFRQQYNINLKETTNSCLHWWEFCALFESLDENVRMAKVMYWRTCSLTGLPKEQRKFIVKMRALYAIDKADRTLDNEARLAKRNADMIAYVKRRASERNR